MGLFFRSYDKPGPGVDPDAPQKRSFFRFFDIFWRKFWHFSKANLLYCLALIPTFIVTLALIWYVTSGMLSGVITAMQGDTTNEGIVYLILFATVIFANFYVSFMGAGPATAGMTFLMRNFSREEHAWIWSDFKDNVKSNFKQSIIVFAIDVVFVLVCFIAATLYRQIGGTVGYLRFILYMIAIVYALMHLYIYPLMITFNLSIKDIYRDSLIFALGKLPSSIFVAVVLFFIHVAVPVLMVLFLGKYMLIGLLIFLILELTILQAFSAFLVNFNAYPKMKKYMLDVIDDNKDEVKVKSLAEEIAEENAEKTE